MQTDYRTILENWDVISELSTYYKWCRNNLPNVIPNCRIDTILIDLTDITGFLPSKVSYGPYNFIRQILKNKSYSPNEREYNILDKDIIKFLIVNGILNSYIIYNKLGYQNDDMVNLIYQINWQKPDELLIDTSPETVEIFFHYWKRLKNILDVNVCKYFRIPLGNLYEYFNVNGIVGINSPDELFDMVGREGIIDYDSIKSLMWIDHRLFVPNLPITILEDNSSLISVKLEVDIYRGGYEVDGKL